MADERCELCRFWFRSSTKGECHRRAPQQAGKWPVTLVTEWCGEFEHSQAAEPFNAEALQNRILAARSGITESDHAEWVKAGSPTVKLCSSCHVMGGPSCRECLDAVRSAPEWALVECSRPYIASGSHPVVG